MSVDVASGWNGAVATNLLTSVTNPQGLTTQMAYQMLNQNVCPYMVSIAAPVCQRVIQPNGIEFYFSDVKPDGDWPSNPGGIGLPATQQWWEWMGSANHGGIVLSTGGFVGNHQNGTFTVNEHAVAGNADTNGAESGHFENRFLSGVLFGVDEHRKVHQKLGGDLRKVRHVKSGVPAAGRHVLTRCMDWKRMS